MARRKKEQATKVKTKTGKAVKGVSGFNNPNIFVPEKSVLDNEDGSSPDEFDNNSEILNPEDIQTIVVGALGTVSVTKASSEDENEIHLKTYSVPVYELSRANPSGKIECEHPKKKIVRLLERGYSLDDPPNILVNDGNIAANNSTSIFSEVKKECDDNRSFQVDEKVISTSKYFTGKVNGDIDSDHPIEHEPLVCEEETIYKTNKGEIYSETAYENDKVMEKQEPRYVDNRLMQEPIEENYYYMQDNQGSADDDVEYPNSQDHSEFEVPQGSLTVIDEYREEDQGTRSSESIETDVEHFEVIEEDVNPVIPDNEADIKENFFHSAVKSKGAKQSTSATEPLTEKLSNVSLTCDAENVDSCVVHKVKMQICDPLSTERVKDAANEEKIIVEASKSKSCYKSDERTRKMSHTLDSSLNNHIVHEKLETDTVKAMKGEEKIKKLVKRESNNKQGKKSEDNYKPYKGEKQDDSSASESRRRSTRLKSRPDYNDKYEENLLQACMDKVSNVDHNEKNENSRVKLTDKGNAEPSAIISIEAAEMPVFQHVSENEYHTERTFSKDAERMTCDCVLTKEEIIREEMGCGEDCLNRLLLIECCSRCQLGDRCTNKRFQKRTYTKCEVFKTPKKGNGLKVLEDIQSGTFIMEYVGEVIDSDEFERRAMDYARNKIPHFYFMSLKSDCIIDATMKGNCSRFINHSCEPNAETQKWTVQGELRIGFFSKRDISAGEEITFDYQLQRYGKQAQRCYCETPSCSGWIGEDPGKQTDEDRPKERKKKKQRDQYLDVESALEEISQSGLINRHQTLCLNRLMVHAKELPLRLQILQLIEEGHPACRRLFVDYHGLPIIWSWMVDCAADEEDLKIQLLKTLRALPITNKTILMDSKVYPQVEQWAFSVEQKLRSEALSAQSVLESVEDIATAEETPVSEMAQKVLNFWSSLREAYRIPKKERIQQMKEHEREADQNIIKSRPRRLPLYAEKMRDKYHRNRYNRDKDFDKIYYDRCKRKDSPDNRNHEQRDHHYRKEFKEISSGSRVSKLEHRYMFELKVRKQEEKRKWEEDEQKFWLQQNQGMYFGAQRQLLPGQFVSPVPNTPYSSDANAMSSVSASQLSTMLQNIQSLTSTSTATHGFYGTASSYISPNIMLPHLAPHSASSQTSTSSVFSQQISPLPTYYQNVTAVTATYPTANATPTPVSYPHQALAEIDRAEVKIENNYDYQPVQSPSSHYDQHPFVDNTAYALYNGSRLYGNTSSAAEKSEPQYVANYSTSEEIKARAIANKTATDLTKIKLPRKWKAVRDSEGRIYYYHTKTRYASWYPPDYEDSPQTEEIGQTDGEESDEEETHSVVEEAEEEERQETRKRRNFNDFELMSKRRHSGGDRKEVCNQDSFDMDPDLKENSAAMSSLFQYSDDDYSPIIKDVETQKTNEIATDEISNNTPLPSNIPLITEHIISPREPISKEERIRNKKRYKSIKEKRKKHKREKRKASAVEENSVTNSGTGNGGVISISSSDILMSAPADTSSNSDRKKKEAFRANMADFVKNCLNPYFKNSGTTPRITNSEDFKHLARKLTYFVMVKEIRHCRSVTDLTCNSSVKHKAKEYIKKYMAKFGDVYVRPPNDNSYN